MERTRAQYIQGLRNLADRLEQDKEIPEPGNLYLHAWEKSDLLKMIRQFGGSWEKSLSYGETDIQLESRKFPLIISISRDKVCKKVVTYDCEPMFSPQDAQDLDAALIPKPEPVVVDDDVPF